MQFAQYKRIESKAGGVHCTAKEFVKAAHTCLSLYGKGRQARKNRHEWLRGGFALLNHTQHGYINWESRR